MSTRVVTYATVRERVSERGVSGRVWQRYYRRIRKSRPEPMDTQTPTRHDSSTRPDLVDLTCADLASHDVPKSGCYCCCCCCCFGAKENASARTHTHTHTVTP